MEGFEAMDFSRYLQFHQSTDLPAEYRLTEDVQNAGYDCISVVINIGASYIVDHRLQQHRRMRPCLRGPETSACWSQSTSTCQ